MVLDIIIKFVEGKMTVKEFQEELHTNDDLVKVLSDNIAISSAHLTGESLYEYIERTDINTLIGLVNSLGNLEDFLLAQQIKFIPNEEPLKKLRLMGDVEPSWLNLPDFYMDKLINKFKGQSGKVLKDSMKAQILEDFKYLKKPRWLQSPDWLFVDEKPLLFIGQLDIKELRFDTAQVYVFLDEETDTYHFTEQFT